MPDYINDPALLAQLDGSAAPAARTPKTKAPRLGTPEDFAAAYGPAAERAGKALGVDPQLLLGQWGLETGWGKSVIPGTNNLGNIKDLSGGGVGATDNMTGSRDKYRSYDSPEAFADDYASLIQRKYPNAVGAKDAQSFAQALKAGGYAEDPRYVDKVVQASRMASNAPGPVMRAVRGAVESVVPSAQAAQPAPTSAPASGRQYVTDEALLGQLNAPTADAPALGNAPATGDAPGKAESLAAGLGRGTGNVALNIQKYAGKGAKALGADQVGDWLIKDAEQGQAKLSAENAPYKEANPLTNATGEVGGEILSTLPVGGILKKGVQTVAELPVVSRYAGPVLNRLANAFGSSGASVGANAGGTAAGNLLLRSVGGAGTGYGSAMLVNEDSGGLGAAMGGLFPAASKAVGYGANALGATLRPFYAGGQNRILGDVLRQFADDPAAARTALRSAQEVVPGSAPTAVTASGDAGLAALSRAAQNASPEYASNLAARQTAQNQARTAAIEGIAGNTGKLQLAKEARDALTGPMREQVLADAGMVPTDSILRSIDRLIADPNNAGRLSQQALSQFRSQIENLSRNGAIDARALYEVRKDISTTMSGKLQGEAGNLRYARGQLDGVQSIIDDAIDMASRRVQSSAATAPGAASTSREVAAFTPSTEVGMPRSALPAERGATQIGPARASEATGEAVGGARPTWRGYLESYARESIPINQMEELEKVLKAVQTGTVDSQGGLVLSAAKLNNLMKNQGSDLIKKLSPEQLDVLRRVQADLNASQLAGNVGRSVGSNTVQNLAQNQLLTGVLGSALGGSTAARTTLGRVLQLPYGAANQQLQERLGNALLNPQEAARLLSEPQTNALRQALEQNAAQLTYRSAPVLTAQ